MIGTLFDAPEAEGAVVGGFASLVVTRSEEGEVGVVFPRLDSLKPVDSLLISIFPPLESHRLGQAVCHLVDSYMHNGLHELGVTLLVVLTVGSLDIVACSQLAWCHLQGKLLR